VPELERKLSETEARQWRTQRQRYPDENIGYALEARIYTGLMVGLRKD